MIFQDACALQQALERDLDALIQLVKGEQQDYFLINELLTKIFHNRTEIQSSIFVHDQINQYRQIIEESFSKQTHYQHAKKNITDAYAHITTINQSIMVLLKRVTFRVQQIIYNSINQLTSKPAYAYQEYHRFKVACQRLLVESPPDKPLAILKCISDFTSGKLNKSILTLTLVANNLENGNIQEIDRFKISSVINKTTEREAGIKGNKSACFDNSAKIRTKLKEKSAVIKQQLKNNDKSRYQIIQKKARKVMENIKDVMELNRQQYLDDFVSICQQQCKDRLLKEMLQRNKFNQRQIASFIHKKAHLHRRRITSNIQVKQGNIHNELVKVDLTKIDDPPQSNCHTTRKSLLLKFKQNDYRERTVTSQFYRNINRAEEHRVRLRNSQKKSNDVKTSQKEKKKGLFQTIEEVIAQNEEFAFKAKAHNMQSEKEKLPLLNKRAHSVDQNYKSGQLQLLDTNPNALSNSIKLSESIKKKIKIQKHQMLPSKIKIQLRTVNNALFSELSKRLSKFGNFKRHICL